MCVSSVLQDAGGLDVLALLLLLAATHWRSLGQLPAN